MAFEKRWESIPPVSFTADGTVDGLVTLASTKGFKTKQKVNLQSNTQDNILLEIKRVLSKTQLVVGPIGQSITTFSDISAYLQLDSASILAGEQPRPSIPLQEHERAVYEEEPIIARRSYLVDGLGEPYDDTNPLPVDAIINVSSLDTSATNCNNYTIVYTTADVEQSLAIPNGARKVIVAVRDKSAKIRIAYISNGTITGPGENYTTVDLGNIYIRENIKLTGKTLYYQANKNNIVIEIEIWV